MKNLDKFKEKVKELLKKNNVKGIRNIINEIVEIFEKLNIDDFDENLLVNFGVSTSYDGLRWFEIENGPYKLEIQYIVSGKKVSFNYVAIKINNKQLTFFRIDEHLKLIKPLINFISGKYEKVEDVIKDFIDNITGKSFSNLKGSDRKVLDFLANVLQSSKDKNKVYLGDLNSNKDILSKYPGGVVYNKEDNEILIFLINQKKDLEDISSVYVEIEHIIIKPTKVLNKDFFYTVGSKAEILRSILENFEIDNKTLKRIISDIFPFVC